MLTAARSPFGSFGISFSEGNTFPGLVDFFFFFPYHNTEEATEERENESLF